MRTLFTLILVLLTASCGGGPRGQVVQGPTKFPPYPTLSSNERVFTEATFFTDHADIFTTDLTRRGILPVAVKVGIKERSSDEVVYALAGQNFDPHFYLQDGTPLTWVPADKVVREGDRAANTIAQRSLPLSLLQDWDDAQAGFLFFAFDADRVRISGTKALTTRGDVSRELDLIQSVLSYSVKKDDSAMEMFVGVQSGRERSR